MEQQLQKIASRITEEETKASGVESDVQDLLEQLKKLKIEEESLDLENKELEEGLQKGKKHLTVLAEESK